MAILRLNRSRDEVSGLAASMRSWVNVLPPRNSKWAYDYQFWLGANVGLDCWGLFAFPTSETCIEANSGRALAWLEDVNVNNVPAIGSILFDAYEASRSPGGVVHIGPIEIPSLHRAPTVADIGSIFPNHWLPLPATLELSFELSEGAGVDSSLYEKYDCKTVEDALLVVMKPRTPGLLLHYSVVADPHAIPLLPYEVDRPLRGGSKCSPKKRPSGNFARMCEIYQHVRRRVGFGAEPAYYDKHAVRLAVGGRSAEEAESNWSAVAKSLKLLSRHLLQTGEAAMKTATAKDFDPLKLLLTMNLEDRLEAVAQDLQSKTQQFSSIDAQSLASALGISDCERPGSGENWSFVRYAQIVSVEEHAQMQSPASEVVYLIEDQVEPDRFAELQTLSEPLDETDNPKFDFLTKGEREMLELAIAEKDLERHSSNGMNCLAHISVQTSGLVDLEFEAVIEDDGSSFILRTPYDKLARKFEDLTNCVTDSW